VIIKPLIPEMRPVKLYLKSSGNELRSGGVLKTMLPNQRVFSLATFQISHWTTYQLISILEIDQISPGVGQSLMDQSNSNVQHRGKTEVGDQHVVYWA